MIETSYLVHSSNTTCSSQSMTNWPLKWAWSRSRDPDLKFGTPSITFEWIKILALNFVRKYINWSSLSVDEKLTQRRRGLGHVTHVEILRPLKISAEWLKLETYYSVNMSSIICSSQCTTNWPHKIGVISVTRPKFKMWDPSITFEWIKIRALNFVRLHVARSPLSADADENSTPQGSDFGHVTHFEVLGSAL